MKYSPFVLAVVVLLLSACTGHNSTPGAGQLNTQASLPAGFNFSKMGFKVIASSVNKKLGTMSTLYGNDSARATAIAGSGKCLPGTVFALVTWQQQPDKRWIGGNIPGNLLSIEMLKYNTMGKQSGAGVYSRFKGAELKADPDTAGQSERTMAILSLKPSVMF